MEAIKGMHAVIGGGCQSNDYVWFCVWGVGWGRIEDRYQAMSAFVWRNKDYSSLRPPISCHLTNLHIYWELCLHYLYVCVGHCCLRALSSGRVGIFELWLICRVRCRNRLGVYSSEVCSSCSWHCTLGVELFDVLIWDSWRATWPTTLPSSSGQRKVVWSARVYPHGGGFVFYKFGVCRDPDGSSS